MFERWCVTPGTPGALLLPALMLIRLGGALLLAISFGGSLPAPLLAQDRLIRTFGEQHGLEAPSIHALAQDSLGFIWIGGEAGLFRFDGIDIMRWAADTIAGSVNTVTVAPDGRIVARQWTGRLYEVTPQGARSLPDPPGMRTAPSHGTVFDRDGVLWVVNGDSVAYLDRARAEWRVVDHADLDRESPWFVVQDVGTGVLVITDAGLWRVGRDRRPSRLFSAPTIAAVAATGADRILILLNAPRGHGGRVVELVDGIATELLSPAVLPPARAISLVERRGTIWVALDRYLVAVRAGEPPEILGWEYGSGSGGPLLVDREESLWLGTYTGLLQFPEPETRMLAEREGLPSRHVRFLARSINTLWVVTWSGAGYLHDSAEGLTAVDELFGMKSEVCTDGTGAAWGSVPGFLLELRDTVITRWPAPEPEPDPPSLHGCVAGRDGGVWLGTRHGLYYADPARTGIKQVPGPPAAVGARRPALLHDRHDRVWVGAGDQICHAPARRVLNGEDGHWTCAAVPDVGLVATIVELPSGGLWAASNLQGMLAYDAGEWRRLPMPDEPTRTVFALKPSPLGGWWMAGKGILKRVAEAGSGWTVLEELTTWHGLAVSGGSDIVEDEDGTLWIATARGVVHVPGEVRSARRPAPRVALVRASVDERGVQGDSILKLRQGRNRLALSFAALSFRDPVRVRHQIRLKPDEPWSESRGRPSFRWADLGPGDYGVEYRASLDGRQWSEEPIRFTFQVHPQWYRTWWFLALSASLAAVLAWVAYQARVSSLLRLERQRTRIAMDLHDEVGSGLASVGILSGVLASEVLEVDERRRTATEIAAAAEELGQALSDIVWSLDARAATLEELASRLAEHGSRLFADGCTAFVTRFPDRWPAERPDVTVRRNVLFVGLEALHNAARHAHAGNVVLSLTPYDGTGWELMIHDDGIGLDPSVGNGNRRVGNGAKPSSGTGRGLPGMRHRAAEIGARLSVRSNAGAGTTLLLRFQLTPTRSHAFERLARLAGL